MTDARPIIVGVDGSPPSIEAAKYAAALAERRRVALHLIHGYLRPLYGADPWWPEGFSDEEVRLEIEADLNALATRLRAEHPRLAEVRALQINGFPSAALIERSRDAQVTVVGSRGVGGFTRLLVGSVGAQVAAYGHGPVIVTRASAAHHAPRPRPILIGYDGSAGADVALEFAVREARLRPARLIVTNVYTGDEARAIQMLKDAVKPWATTGPDMPMEIRTIWHRDAAVALMEASRDAALTVVGARGRGGFARLILGSVSRSLVHHSKSTVAVVHQSKVW